MRGTFPTGARSTFWFYPSQIYSSLSLPLVRIVIHDLSIKRLVRKMSGVPFMDEGLRVVFFNRLLLMWLLPWFSYPNRID